MIATMATNMIKRKRAVKRTHSSEQFEMEQNSAFNHSMQAKPHVTTFHLPEDLSEKKIRPSSGSMYEEPISSFLPERFHRNTPGKDKPDNVSKRISKRLSSTEEDIAMRASPDSDSILDHSEDCLNPGSNMHEFGLNGRPYQLNETTQLETLENFAKEFKQKRIKLGYTQGDVGLAMGKLYNHDFSQTTISRFEALNLSFKNMCKLRPLLEKWLNYTHQLAEHTKEGKQPEVFPFVPQFEGDQNHGRKRKKRTSIDQKRRDALDKIFNKNPKPTSDDLHSIAEECGLDKEVVRVWFCNRRQKEKRIQIHEQQSHEEDVTPPDSPRSNVFSMTPHQRDSSSSYESLPQRNDLIPPPMSVPGAITMTTSNSKMEDEVPNKRRNVGSLLNLHTSKAHDKRDAKDQPFSPMGKFPNPMQSPMGCGNPNSLNHPLLLSAQAAQGNQYIPPAYSALDGDQYRKPSPNAKSIDRPMYLPQPNFYSSTNANATSNAAIGKTLSSSHGGAQVALASINGVMPTLPSDSQQAFNTLFHHSTPTSGPLISLSHSFQINAGNASTI